MASWRLAPCLKLYIQEANTLAPNRSRSSDGTIGDTAHQARPSDHNPDSRGIVHAVDLTHDPAHNWDAHARIEELRKKKDRRVKYAISNGRIFTSYRVGSRAAWEWGPYSGKNPHRQHAHLSALQGMEDDLSPWFQSGGDSDVYVRNPKTGGIYHVVGDRLSKIPSMAKWKMLEKLGASYRDVPTGEDFWKKFKEQ